MSRALEFGFDAVAGLAKLAAALIAVTAGLVGLTGCQSVSHPQSSRPASVAHGGRIYDEHCSGCHARQGTGDAFLAVPALAGQKFEYLRRQIERFSLEERHNPRMRRAFQRVSMNSPEAAWDLASYLAQLPPQRFADGDPRYRDEGALSFSASCAACHGIDAGGNADGSIPALRAQHDSYLVSRLRQFDATSPTVRIAAHQLNEHAIIALCAYLSSLRGLDRSTPPAP